MSSLQTIKIASCANEKFAPGLMMSLISCLAHASGQYHYEFVVLDGGLEQQSKERLKELLSQCANRVEANFSLEFILPTQEQIRALPERPGSGSWMTYARFLLAEMVEGDSLIYLDSDVLCMRGLEEFYTRWDGEAAIVAARDPKEQLKKDYPFTKDKPGDDELYFNAGIILMNLNWMRENLSLAQVQQWIDKIGLDKLKFADQTILNLAARRSVIEVDRKNNWVLATYYAGKVSEIWQQANLHYIGRIKPWLRDDAEPTRLFSEVLYYMASKAYGVGCVSPRKVNPEKLKSTRQKAFWYRFIKPSRAKAYQAALDSMEASKLLEGISEAAFYK